MIEKNIVKLLCVLGFLCAALIATIWLSGFSFNENKAVQLEAIAPPASNVVAVAQGRVGIEGGVVELSAGTTGVVREVLAAEGDLVTRGQILAILEDKDEIIREEKFRITLKKAQLNLKQRQIELANREKELERAKLQREKEAISAQALELAENNVTSSRISLTLQELEMQVLDMEEKEIDFAIEQRKIRSPIDGRIIDAPISLGGGTSSENVTTLFKLVPHGQRQVTVAVDSLKLDKIRIDQQVLISPTHDMQQTYDGKVTRISDIYLENQNKINVTVSAGDLPLRIGQPVTLQFTSDKQSDVAMSAAVVE